MNSGVTDPLMEDMSWDFGLLMSANVSEKP